MAFICDSKVHGEIGEKNFVAAKAIYRLDVFPINEDGGRATQSPMKRIDLCAACFGIATMGTAKVTELKSQPTPHRGAKK